MPSQSSSRALPGASNAPGLTRLGSAAQVVESQQSPSHAPQPSPSRSGPSSITPSQSSSVALVQLSSAGSCCPSQAVQIRSQVQVVMPPLQSPTPLVPAGPV